jgi:hypothetical protein
MSCDQVNLRTVHKCELDAGYLTDGLAAVLDPWKLESTVQLVTFPLQTGRFVGLNSSTKRGAGLTTNGVTPNLATCQTIASRQFV